MTRGSKRHNLISNRESLCTIKVVFWICLIGACSGQQSAGDATPAIDANPKASFPHGLCEPLPSYPDSIGRSCPAGSNQSLCLMQSSDSCDDRCLWHADPPAGSNSYCTIECSPSDSNGCPPLYSCQQDACEGTYACVRSVDSVPSPVTVTPDALDAFILVDAGMDSEGRQYWLDGFGRLYQRTPSGTWQELGQFGSNTSRARGMIIADDTAYAWGGQTSDHRWFISVRDGIVTEGDLGVNILSVFKSFDGRLIALLGTMPITAVEIHADLSSSALPLTQIDLSNHITELTEYGFISKCGDELCVGADNQNIKVIPAPPGFTQTTSTDAFQGLTPDNIWFGDVHHFDGDRWTEEQLPDKLDNFDPRSLVVTGDDTALLVEEERILYLDGTCWRSVLAPGALVPHTEPLFLVLGNNKVVWVDNRTDYVEFEF